MKAIQFLKQIKKIDNLIENKQAEVQRWKDIATNSAVNMSGERVKSSGSTDTIANAICTYIDLEREDIHELFKKREEIIKVIEQLNATEYDVLHKIYVQGLTFQEVATMRDRSYSWVTTIHGHAIKSVQKILDAK
jgi:DNA-directed RNA polymerase specialized sigma subunit